MACGYGHIPRLLCPPCLPPFPARSAETFQLLQSVQFPWAVNYAVVDPAGRLAAVVGDNEVAQLTDLASGNSRPVAELQVGGLQQGVAGM